MVKILSILYMVACLNLGPVILHLSTKTLDGFHWNTQGNSQFCVDSSITHRPIISVRIS